MTEILESKDFNGSAFGQEWLASQLEKARYPDFYLKLARESNLLPRFWRVNPHPLGVRPAKLIAFPRSPTTWKLTVQINVVGAPWTTALFPSNSSWACLAIRSLSRCQLVKLSLTPLATLDAGGIADVPPRV